MEINHYPALFLTGKIPTVSTANSKSFITYLLCLKLIGKTILKDIRRSLWELLSPLKRNTEERFYESPLYYGDFIIIEPLNENSKLVFNDMIIDFPKKGSDQKEARSVMIYRGCLTYNIVEMKECRIIESWSFKPGVRHPITEISTALNNDFLEKGVLSYIGGCCVWLPDMVVRERMETIYPYGTTSRNDSINKCIEEGLITIVYPEKIKLLCGNKFRDNYGKIYREEN